MQRLPVYLVLDISASMQGEPIEAVRNGVDLIVSTLRSDPYALETAYLSVIVFNDTAEQLVPLTGLLEFQTPTFREGSRTALGDALRLTKECIENEVQKTTAEAKGDWKPLVFIMTDGMPTDDWESGLEEFREIKTGMVIACAAGAGADVTNNVLKKISDQVVSLDVADATTMKAFFKYISSTISAVSRSVEETKTEPTNISQLPPPPDEIIID